MFFALSVRIIRLRRSLRIGIGDGGNPQLLRAMRVHANLAEYAPLTLLLIFMLELQGAHAVLVHLLGIILVIGRLLHAYGVSQTSETLSLRVTGMAMTFTALLAAAIGMAVLGVLRLAA